MHALVLLVALSAQAPTTAPSSPGTPAGAPTADLDGLQIVRERLVLDLSAVGARGGVTVEAEYRVVNGGASRTLPLEFVQPTGRAGGVRVWLDDQPVRGRPVDAVEVPAAWTAGSQTPALDGERLPYRAATFLERPRGVRFRVEVPPGQHSVRVRYRAEPGSYDAGGHPNRAYQFAYGLAPARRWAGFGQLDVEVRVPPGWDAAASLPLRREADALVGRFGGVPGDVLAVSVRAPVSPLRRPLQVAGVLAWAVVVGLFGVASGRLAAQAREGPWWALKGSVLGGIVGAVVFVIFQLVALDTGSGSRKLFDADATVLAVGLPAALVAGVAVAQLAAVWARRRWGQT